MIFFKHQTKSVVLRFLVISQCVKFDAHRTVKQPDGKILNNNLKLGVVSWALLVSLRYWANNAEKSSILLLSIII